MSPSLLLLALGLIPEDVRFDPLSPRQGDLVVFYVRSEAKEGSAELFGHKVAIFPVGPGLLRGAAPIPMEAELGPQPIELILGEERLRTTVDVSGRTFDQSELTVNKQFTKKPDAALRARLKREEAEMKAVWDAAPSKDLAVGVVVRPVPGEITGNFGTARVFNGKAKSTHLGLDLDGDEGDPVRAALGGKVVLSSLRFASGGTLVIDHGGGLFTLYFHLSRRDKKKGDQVTAGELIGAVGKTGRVTGPHLHLAVVSRVVMTNGKKAGQARSMYVDPQAFLGLTLAGPDAAPAAVDEAPFGGGRAANR